MAGFAYVHQGSFRIYAQEQMSSPKRHQSLIALEAICQSQFLYEGGSQLEFSISSFKTNHKIIKRKNGK
jgi:hypothetical protein